MERRLNRSHASKISLCIRQRIWSGECTPKSSWKRHRTFSQRGFFLRTLGWTRSPQECLLTYGCTLWLSSCTSEERKDLQRITNKAHRITGNPLPGLKDVYSSRLLKRAENIRKDYTHPDPSLRQIKSHKGTGKLPEKQIFRLSFERNVESLSWTLHLKDLNLMDFMIEDICYWFYVSIYLFADAA